MHQSIILKIGNEISNALLFRVHYLILNVAATRGRQRSHTTGLAVDQVPDTFQCHRIPGLSDNLSQLNQIGSRVGHVTDEHPHLVPHAFDGVLIWRVFWPGQDLNLLLSEETTCVTRGVASSIVTNEHRIVLKLCPCIRNHGIPRNVDILEMVEGAIDEHKLGFGTMVDSAPNHAMRGSVAMSFICTVIQQSFSLPLVA